MGRLQTRQSQILSLLPSIHSEEDLVRWMPSQVVHARLDLLDKRMNDGGWRPAELGQGEGEVWIGRDVVSSYSWGCAY